MVWLGAVCVVLHVCITYTWGRPVIVPPFVTVMRSAVIWKDHFSIVVKFDASPSPLTAVGNGYLKHHSKNSTSKIRPIAPECYLQTGCICEECEEYVQYVCACVHTHMTACVSNVWSQYEQFLFRTRRNQYNRILLIQTVIALFVH